jgi:hypothetical protein
MVVGYAVDELAVSVIYHVNCNMVVLLACGSQQKSPEKTESFASESSGRIVEQRHAMAS